MNALQELINGAFDFNDKLLTENTKLMKESLKRYEIMLAALRKLHKMSMKYAALKKVLRSASCPTP